MLCMDDKMIMMSQTQSESESLPTSVKWVFYQVKMLKTYEIILPSFCSFFQFFVKQRSVNT